MNSVEVKDLGLMPYKEAWDLQLDLFQSQILNKQNNINTSNYLLLVEHPHVYTLGKSANENNMLASESYLQSIGAETYTIERGGDITYHGPGQLVVYPIFDLEKLKIGIKTYIEKIETSIINTLLHFGINAFIIKGKVGVWVIHENKEKKIAAIGIKCSRYITMHGLALNINTNLNMFNHIVPCGIQDKEVTSMQGILNQNIAISNVKEIIIQNIVNIFDLNL